jgi:hypothetical protein
MVPALAMQFQPHLNSSTAYFIESTQRQSAAIPGSLQLLTKHIEMMLLEPLGIVNDREARVRITSAFCGPSTQVRAALASG